MSMLIMTGGVPALASSGTYAGTESSMSAVVSIRDNSAKKSTSKEFGDEVAKAGKYMRTAPDGSFYFDVDAAKASGESATILEVGVAVNQFSAVQNGRSDDTMSARGLPLWGNWCGPGHGGGSAVDVLDSICRTHDQCYGSRGYFACSCDRNIVESIKRNINRMSGGQRVAASAVSVYFTYSACNPFK